MSNSVMIPLLSIAYLLGLYFVFLLLARRTVD